MQSIVQGLWVVQQGINLILDQNGYAEIGVRIGIDIGDQNAVLQYGWNIIHTLNSDNSTHNQQIVKSPHYDIIGYTVNVAVKNDRTRKAQSSCHWPVSI